MREQLRSLVAAANAPLGKRVSALELAYQEQRAQLVAYRHADAATLKRVTAQRDDLQGLLASAMDERDAWEARAGEVGAERDAVAARVAELLKQRDDALAERDAAEVKLSAAEARAHDLANEVMALREDGDVDATPEPTLPRLCQWVGRMDDAISLVDVSSPAGPAFATVERDGAWRTFAVLSGCMVLAAAGREPSSQHIAKEQALEAVREHWGPVEVVG